MRTPARLALPLLIAAAALFEAGCAARCSVKKNETAEIYPTYAAWDDKAHEWRMPVHGRIYEPSVGSTARNALSLLRSVLQIPDGADDRIRLFEERAEGFLIKAPQGRNVSVKLSDKYFKASRLDRGGHFENLVRLPAGIEKDKTHPATEPVEVEGCGDQGAYEGQVFFLPSEGTSVVSTVEDTLQVTGVGKGPELVSNLFFRPYRAVDGMPDLLAEWQRSGAAIHYVAVAPWQLYGPVSRFLNASGYPPGTFHMNRWGDTDAGVLERLENVVGLFSNARRHTTGEITALIQAFPKRNFILVGNTAGGDAAAFAELARRFPDRIRHLYLRQAPDAGNADRVTSALEGLPAARWTIFTDPREIPTDLSRL